MQPAGLLFDPRRPQADDKRAAQRPLISPGAPKNEKPLLARGFSFFSPAKVRTAQPDRSVADPSQPIIRRDVIH